MPEEIPQRRSQERKFCVRSPGALRDRYRKYVEDLVPESKSGGMTDHRPSHRRFRMDPVLFDPGPVFTVEVYKSERKCEQKEGTDADDDRKERRLGVILIFQG